MGIAFRCCLVAGWLALFGAHVWRFVLPGIGLAERHDLGAGLAMQVDRTLIYDLVRRNADGAVQTIGSSELTVAKDDAGFRCELRVELATLSAGINSSSAEGPAIRILVSEKLDDRFRLTAVTAHGEIMGMRIVAQATIDHRGLTGTITFAGKQLPVALPDFGRDDGAAAMDLGVTLPPGLSPGDRFRSTMLDISITLTPSKRDTVFTAHRRETVNTRSGPLDLLKVEASSDGKLHSTYWCDASGTIYRSDHLANRSLGMELVSIHASSGQLIWPPEAKP